MRKLLTSLLVALSATFSFAGDFPAAEVAVNGPAGSPTKYPGSYIAGSAVKSVTAPLFYGGVGSAAPADPSTWAGKIILLDRGINSFVQKMNIAKTAGAVGVIVANNVAGSYTASLGTSSSTLPGVTVSQQDGGKLRLNVGQSVTVSLAGVVVPPPPPTIQNGLTGVYFGNKDLAGTPIKTVVDSTINFNWTTGSPENVPADGFSIRWSGYIKPEFSEIYTFIASCDDGVRLWVNGIQIVDRWSDSGSIVSSGEIALVANQTYSIVLEYYENSGWAGAKLYWSSPSLSKEIVPTNRLFVSQPNTVPVPPVAPAIVNQPVSASVNTGSSFSFGVTATGTSPLSYQWKKNGTNISGAISSTYAVSAAQTSDSGSYTVTVSNSVGSVTSNAAILTVNTVTQPPGQPPIASIATKVIVGIIPENTVNMFVTVEGTEPIALQWKLNGVPIAGATNTRLTLSGPTMVAGDYSVTATNIVGSATSAVYELKIVQP